MTTTDDGMRLVAARFDHADGFLSCCYGLPMALRDDGERQQQEHGLLLFEYAETSQHATLATTDVDYWRMLANAPLDVQEGMSLPDEPFELYRLGFPEEWKNPRDETQWRPWRSGLLGSIEQTIDAQSDYQTTIEQVWDEIEGPRLRAEYLAAGWQRWIDHEHARALND